MTDSEQSWESTPESIEDERELYSWKSVFQVSEIPLKPLDIKVRIANENHSSMSLLILIN